MGQDHPNFKGAWLEDMGGWDGPLKRICSQIWDEPIRENQPDRFIPISLPLAHDLHAALRSPFLSLSSPLPISLAPARRHPHPSTATM